MQSIIAERFPGRYALHQQSVVGSLGTIFPMGTKRRFAAVKQYDRTWWRRRAERRALALDSFQPHRLGQLLNHIRIAIDSTRRLLVPTRTRQPAFINDDLEIAIATRDHLHRLGGSCVLALD